MTDWSELLTEDEWEKLCDCCGLCCLYKVQDEDTGEVFYTSVVCPLLNRETARCLSYADRFKKMPSCTKISPESLPEIARWLPKSCAYRCLAEGTELPVWHPLRSDPSPEAAGLLKKLEAVCIRPNTCITAKTAERIIRNSRPPKSTHKLTRLLLANIITEDI